MHISFEYIYATKMIISCAYCERMFGDFNIYKYHLKILHNKKTYGDKLLCGQGGCPRDFTRFQTLTDHIEKVHFSLVGVGDMPLLKKQWSGRGR